MAEQKKKTPSLSSPPSNKSKEGACHFHLSLSKNTMSNWIFCLHSSVEKNTIRVTAPAQIMHRLFFVLCAKEKEDAIASFPHIFPSHRERVLFLCFVHTQHTRFFHDINFKLYTADVSYFSLSFLSLLAEAAPAPSSTFSSS